MYFSDSCPRRVLAQMAKTRGGIQEVPAYKGLKFRFFKNRARKGLPKLRWGSKKHSKESGSVVFARDSEVEREELYLIK